MARTPPLLLVVSLLVAAASLSAPVAADHGSKSNYTVYPHDRQPGISDASYEQHATAPTTIDYLDYIGATWKEGGFADCGATNSEVFGIDRGNDDPGRETDHDLTQHVEEFTVTEDEFRADFYEKDDAVGTSTNLDAGDEFVGFTKNCFDNPDEPGWYQIRSSIGGTAPNGSYVEQTDVSHYFAICDCRDEQEARDQLGPPPSEGSGSQSGGDAGTPTATPSENADGTPATSTDASTQGGSTPTSTGGSETSSDAASPSAGGGGDAGPDGSGAEDGGGSGSPTPADDWDSYARETPTVAGGPGFGPLLALLALLGGALVAVRRR